MLMCGVELKPRGLLYIGLLVFAVVEGDRGSRRRNDCMTSWSIAPSPVVGHLGSFL